MTTLLEQGKQLTHLDRQNWRLWTLILVITLSMAVAIAALFYPAIRWGVDLIETRYGILPQLIMGLLVLVFLSAIYVVVKQRELNELRTFIVSSFAEDGRQEGALSKDLLTEVFDRRALPDILQLECKRSDRYNSTLCFVLFDIRGFGEINAKEGNMSGDLVLKDLARTLQATVRHSDVVLRYGADEFLCLLPATGDKGGEIFVRRVAAACEQVGRLRGLILDVGLAVHRVGVETDTVMAQAERELAARKNAPVGEIEVVLECAKCHSRQTAQLTVEQYRALGAAFSLTRPCAKCGVETNWTLGFTEVDQEESAPSTPSSVSSMLGTSSSREDRPSPRFGVSTPVMLVIGEESQKVQHPSRMVDLSETGLRLKTDVIVTPEQIVEVICDEGRKFSEECRVVWVGRPGSEQEGYAGLEFLNRGRR